MLEIYIDRRKGVLYLTKKKMERICEEIFKEAGIKAENIFVNINYITRKNMIKLNKKFNNLNHATNVLSFYPKAFDKKLLYKSNKTMNFYIGDICLCKDIIVEEAKKLNISPSERAVILFTHGMLHLCGFDHKTKEDDKKMYAIQDKVCAKFGIKDYYKYNIYDDTDEE